MKNHLSQSLIRKSGVLCGVLTVLLCLGLFGISGCSSAERRELALARSEVEQGNFRLSIPHFEKVILLDPDSKLGVLAAKEAAKVSFYDIKDYLKARDFYLNIVLYSKDALERTQAQKQIISIFFDHLNNYNQAIVEINKLLGMSLPQTDKLGFKINLAKAYYYLNNFTQAENEIEEFLKYNSDEEQRFSMMLMKGNIALAQKDFTKASSIFKEIIEKFPESSKKENVGITLAVTYEEMKEFKSALEVLEWVKKHHPVPEYIDARIKRLIERQKNQPGARGFKK